MLPDVRSPPNSRTTDSVRRCYASTPGSYRIHRGVEIIRLRLALNLASFSKHSDSLPDHPNSRTRDSFGGLGWNDGLFGKGKESVDRREVHGPRIYAHMPPSISLNQSRLKHYKHPELVPRRFACRQQLKPLFPNIHTTADMALTERVRTQSTTQDSAVSPKPATSIYTRFKSVVLHETFTYLADIIANGLLPSVEEQFSNHDAPFPIPQLDIPLPVSCILTPQQIITA